MTTFCQPLPPSVAQEMLQGAARSICDRPGDLPDARDSRTRQMVHSVMGFDPRDGMELMLATMFFGHYQLILDSMHEVFQGQVDTMKARTKSGIVSLGREMLAFGRDARAARRRPLARGAEAAPRQTEAAPAPGPVEAAARSAERSGVPPAAPAADTRAEPVATAGTRAAEAVSGVPAAPPARPAPPPSAPVLNVRDGMGPATLAEATRIPTTPVVPRPIAPVTTPVSGPVVMNRPGASPPNEIDEETAGHIAAFEAALAALGDTLEEARALNRGKAGEKAASGD